MNRKMFFFKSKIGVKDDIYTRLLVQFCYTKNFILAKVMYITFLS